PIPRQVYFLDPALPPIYIRVTFTAGTSYDQALATISTLGFRLAAPCYEQAQPKPAWHPMGQQSSFASAHSLLIATTGGNATTWHQQLAAVAGVARVTTPYQPTC
ncbi:MAG: hypothetical protein ACRDHP_14075, partial [Ktedonobacterales bacterium]